MAPDRLAAHKGARVDGCVEQPHDELALGGGVAEGLARERHLARAEERRRPDGRQSRLRDASVVHAERRAGATRARTA